MAAAGTSIGEYALRPPREDEFPRILEVVHECELADVGATSLTEEDLRAYTALLDRERDLCVVAGAAGVVIATAAVSVAQPLRMRAFVCVSPAHRGRGIGSALLRFVERRAAEAAAAAPPGEPAVLHQGVGPRNEGARTLLERHGYAFVRRFWTMAIDVDDELPEPRWPAGVRVTDLLAADDRTVYEAMEEAFEDHWGHVRGEYEQWRAWTVEHEGFDPTLWRLVWAGEELAGASLNAVRGGDGWVNVLGVRRPWRRQGIALALLRESFGEFRRRGLERVLLGVDSESPTGATRLYERAGMHVEHSSDMYEKVLREPSAGS